MVNRTEIKDSRGKLVAYKIGGNAPQGLSAWSAPEDYLQTLVWNYPAGKRLAAHAHRNVPRRVTHTQEAVVVLAGRLQANVYDAERRLAGSIDVGRGEVLVLLEGGHGYEILEDGTQVVEIKNGPYPGAEADRVRFEG